MKTTRPPNHALIVNFSRPASFWDALGVHLPFFLISGLPLVLAHTMELQHLPLTPCLLLKFSGFPCPLCGYTRSFQAMANGNFMDAFRNCPMACVLYVACVFMFIWNGGAILSGMRLETGKLLRIAFKPRAWFFLFCLILTNWGYRLVCGLR